MSPFRSCSRPPKALAPIGWLAGAVVPHAMDGQLDEIDRQLLHRALPVQNTVQAARGRYAALGGRFPLRTPLVTALAFVIVFDALAWSLGVLPVLRHAMNHGELPKMAGFTALSGPFEALGLNSLVVAGIVFVAISLLKLLAAYWVSNLRMDGIVLELILLGISAIFWYGFALPLGPLGGLVEIVLMALTWRTFT